MNNERNNEMKPNENETTDTKIEEKRDDHDHLWIDLGGEG